MTDLIPTVQPAEHCGELAPMFGLIGQPGGGTECVLRPGHSGSHADEHGMRWRLTTPAPVPVADATPSSSEEALRCVCGEPSAAGTVHRTDGPCYQAESTDAAADARRAQYANAIARVDAGKWGTEVPLKDHPMWVCYLAYADAVLNVRDAELEQLRREHAALKRAHVALAEQAGRDQAAIARVHAYLIRLCDEPHPSHDHLCPDDVRRTILNALDQPQEEA